MNLQILLIVIGLLFFYQYMNKNNKESSKTVDIVTPHFVYETLNNPTESIILVNVLSDKMKYKLTLNGINDSRSMSKKDFENILKHNNNQIPVDIKKVIIYCAAWSCSGAKNYYKKLIKKGVNVSNVVDYIGAIHEWASYSAISPDIFTFHSTIENKRLSEKEIKDIRLYTAHDYFVDNVLKGGLIKEMSENGKAFKQYL